jgi:AMMECR1 domain-containing protein
VNGEESAFAKLRAKAQSLGETPKVPLPRILANDKSSLFLQMRAKAQGLELVKKVQQKELLPAIELKAKMKNDSIFSQLQAKAQAFEQTENKKSLFKRSVSNELK